MTPFIAAGAGFLLAVLWFDLMFDVQVARHQSGQLPESVLASIANYYRRVTTTARPMNRLVAAVMLGTLGAIVAQIGRGEKPHWVGWASLLLTGAPVLLAAGHTVPRAVRLGRRTDCLRLQAELAISIWRDHVLCSASILAVLAIQLSAG